MHRICFQHVSQLQFPISGRVHGINTLGMATNYIKLWQVNAHVHCREYIWDNDQRDRKIEASMIPQQL